MRTLAFFLTAGIAGLSAAAAQASVESMAEPRDASRNCSAPQESNRFTLWRPADGRLVIGGDGKAQFEFYGHGIDLSPDAGITGISGASARRIDGRGGAVNGARGCGNIGSVIVELSLPDVSAANNGTLRIGSETIPLTATPRVIQDLVWDNANEADGRAVSGSSGAVAIAPSQGIVSGGNNSNSCPVGTPGCPGQSTGVQAPSSSASGVAPDTHTLARCADSLGLRADVSNAGKDLTITLPVERRGLMENCYSQHLLTRYVIKGVNDAVTLPGAAPNLRMTASSGLRASFMPQTGLKDKAGLIFLNRDFVRDFVGRQTFDIDVTPGSSTSKLKLTLVSDPLYGPQSVSAPPVLAVGRLNSDLRLRVTGYQPARQGEAYAWTIRAVDGSGLRCFEQTAGTLAPPIGATQFDVPLRVVETAACYNKSYAATVTTASLAGQVSGSPFDRTVTFTLLPLTVVRIPEAAPAATGLSPKL